MHLSAKSSRPSPHGARRAPYLRLDPRPATGRSSAPAGRPISALRCLRPPESPDLRSAPHPGSPRPRADRRRERPPPCVAREAPDLVPLPPAASVRDLRPASPGSTPTARRFPLSRASPVGAPPPPHVALRRSLHPGGYPTSVASQAAGLHFRSMRWGSSSVVCSLESSFYVYKVQRTLVGSMFVL